jgi:Zn-dependent oligopeptidase
MTNSNPLLQKSELPLFDQIQPSHVNPAVAQASHTHSSALELLTTGAGEPLQNAAYRWLNEKTPVQQIETGPGA